MKRTRPGNNGPWPRSLVQGVSLSLLVGILGVTSGCRTGFRGEWRAAQHESFPADDLAGCWSGRWTSEVNHHTGKLRCILRRQGEGRYLAQYHATYAGIFRFTYSVPLTVRRSENGWTFGGSANLGATAGGEYTYSGEAGATNFFSRYECARDHGTFQMKRVPTLR